MAKNFEEAWDNLINYLSLRHSIEHDMDAGTPPYEESRYYGWADCGDHEGYDDPYPPSVHDDGDVTDFREFSQADLDEDEQPEPELSYWEMVEYDQAIAGWEHLETLSRFERMRG